MLGLTPLRLLAEGRHAGDRRPVRRLDGPRIRHRGRRDGGVVPREQAELKRAYDRQGHLARVLEGDGRLLQGPLEAARRHGLRRGHVHRRRQPRPLAEHHAPARRRRQVRRHLRRLVEPVRRPARPRRSATRASTRRSSPTRRSTARSCRDGPERAQLLRARLRLPATRTARAARTREVAKVNAQFKAEVRPADRQPLRAARATSSRTRLVAAIKKAGSTDGTKHRDRSLRLGPEDQDVRRRPMAFTKKCHRPQPAILHASSSTPTARTSRSTRSSVKKVPEHRRRQPVLGRPAGQVARTSTRSRQRSMTVDGPEPEKLVAEEIRVHFEGVQGRRRRRSDARAGRDHGPDRAERRRQDDVHERRLASSSPLTAGTVTLGRPGRHGLAAAPPRRGAGSCARSRTSRPSPS